MKTKFYHIITKPNKITIDSKRKTIQLYDKISYGKTSFEQKAETEIIETADASGFS